MPTNHNAVALRFAHRADAHRALGDLRHLDSSVTEIRGAVLIERRGDEAVRVPGNVANDVGSGADGGLVGPLVGIVGGPLGTLMGWGVGGVIGEGCEQRWTAEATGTAPAGASSEAGPDETIILTEVKESDPEVLDLLAMYYDAVLERCTADAVRGELEALADAAERIEENEMRDRRDRKRAHERSEARVMTLREKFAA